LISTKYNNKNQKIPVQPRNKFKIKTKNVVLKSDELVHDLIVGRK
jgi:hypothetical protein